MESLDWKLFFINVILVQVNRYTRRLFTVKIDQISTIIKIVIELYSKHVMKKQIVMYVKVGYKSHCGPFL